MLYVSTNRPNYFRALNNKYPGYETIEDQYDLEGKINRVNNQERLLQFKIGQALDENKFKPGDIVIFDGPLGYRCLEYLDNIGKFHFGLRNFDYGTLLKLDVFTHNEVKYVFLDKDKSYNKFDSKYRTLVSGEYFNYRFNYKIPEHEVYTLNEIDKFLQECEVMYSDKGLALDYESFSFPDYYDFQVTGASISSLNKSLFLDFRYFDTPEIETEGKKKFCDFLWKYHDNIWVFNKAFESYATYRMCHKFVDFNDVMALLICDEYPCGLKVAAQQYLRIGSSWDDEQEFLAEKYEWLFSNFKSYQELVEYTKKDGFGESEFDKKIKDIIIHLRSVKQDFGFLRKYWYGSFAVTPIDIVSKYCCMDAFYTLMIKEVIQKFHPNYLQGN